MGVYVDDLDALDFGTKAFQEFMRDKLGVPVTVAKVELAVSLGELKPARLGRAHKFSRRMALEWAEQLGVPIDWDRAENEAKRERAQRAIVEADKQLAELGNGS